MILGTTAWRRRVPATPRRVSTDLDGPRCTRVESSRPAGLSPDAPAVPPRLSRWVSIRMRCCPGREIGGVTGQPIAAGVGRSWLGVLDRACARACGSLVRCCVMSVTREPSLTAAKVGDHHVRRVENVGRIVAVHRRCGGRGYRVGGSAATGFSAERAGSLPGTSERLLGLAALFMFCRLFSRSAARSWFSFSVTCRDRSRWSRPAESVGLRFAEGRVLVSRRICRTFRTSEIQGIQPASGSAAGGGGGVVDESGRSHRRRCRDERTARSQG
jgi:hypothetical protein